MSTARNDLSLLRVQPIEDGREFSLAETERFNGYLRNHLTADFVLRVLEECLLEENANYKSIDFDQALKELQDKDAGRYQMLKVLLEGFAVKEGLVMLDPKMVSASYKQRMAQLRNAEAHESLAAVCFQNR